MAREQVVGTPVPFTFDPEKPAEVMVEGVKIVANRLSRINEFRIGITLPNGSKIVLLHSASGTLQDAGIFEGVEEGMNEIIIPLHGGLRVWSGYDEENFGCTYYEKGEVAEVLPNELHATHPDLDGWAVGVMPGKWDEAKKNAGDNKTRAAAFDVAVDTVIAKEAAEEP